MALDSRSWIDWNVLFRGDYEPHLTALWNRLAPEGGVAVDIGANVGAHTLTMARAVGPRGRVLAFEPNPPVRALMIRNLSLNGIENVTVFDCALGSEPGTLPLRVPKRNSAEFSNIGLASIVALETPHDLVDVDVRTLDDVIASLNLDRVDVVKIDCRRLMASAGRAFACARPLTKESQLPGFLDLIARHPAGPARSSRV